MKDTDIQSTRMTYNTPFPCTVIYHLNDKDNIAIDKKHTYIKLDGNVTVLWNNR